MLSGLLPMSRQFRPITRDTPYLLPPLSKTGCRMSIWLVSLSRLLTNWIWGLSSEITVAAGKRPISPSVLVCLLFYGYATGVFSSRQLERATYDSVAFRFITANTHPDHDTIAHFRKRFLEELAGLFVQILLLAQSMGLLKLGKVSLDGTKVKANASKHKALSWQYREKLEQPLKEEVAWLLAKAEETDNSEQCDWDIPEELTRREGRLAAIAEAKAELARRAQARFEAEQAEYEETMRRRQERAERRGQKPRGKAPKPPQPGPRDNDQVNLTDEESRIMPSANGFVQAYNAQAAVDTDSYLIVENHLTQCPNDKQQVEPTLTALSELEQALDEKVDALLADTGYHSQANTELCDKRQVTPYLCNRREKHNQPLEERHQEPAPCPEDADALTRMHHRLQTRAGKAVYALFGVIKQVMGFRRFHLRGKEAAEGEWNLVSMAWNLKRMHTMVVINSG